MATQESRSRRQEENGGNVDGAGQDEKGKGSHVHLTCLLEGHENYQRPKTTCGSPGTEWEWTWKARPAVSTEQGSLVQEHRPHGIAGSWVSCRPRCATPEEPGSGSEADTAGTPSAGSQEGGSCDQQGAQLICPTWVFRGLE